MRGLPPEGVVGTVKGVALAQERSVDISAIRLNDHNFLFGHSKVFTNPLCNENQLKSLAFG